MHATNKRHSGGDRSLRDLSFDTSIARFGASMAFTKRLDLVRVLSQLEEEFLSAEEEYQSSVDQQTVETDSGSDGEDQITDMRSVSTAEQVDVTADIHEGEEENIDQLPPLHPVDRVEEMIESRQEEEILQDDSTVSIERSFEDKE